MQKYDLGGFKVGDLAVYPSHGVGVVKGIKRYDVSGTNQNFYVLKVLDSEATIMVPVNNSSTVGLRKVIKKSLVPKVYAILKQTRRGHPDVEQEVQGVHGQDQDRMRNGAGDGLEGPLSAKA
jgi:RNA polymerase-interacting CarD/CdnL/TRCF family regulator